MLPGHLRLQGDDEVAAVLAKVVERPTIQYANDIEFVGGL
jgi:hypothetical protein